MEGYSDVHRFPLSLSRDSHDQRMVLTELVGDRDVDELIGIIFEKHPEVDYLHARNAKACCYICRIERAN